MFSQKIRWMRLRIVRRMARLSKQVRRLPMVSRLRFGSIVVSVVVTISKVATILQALSSLRV
jgi:hypothetical protein